MGIIKIEGMEFYAFHGCSKDEQKVGNHFWVDVFIETNLQKPSLTDNLNDTINYQLIYFAVKNEMQKTSHLLENVASRILQTLCTEFSAIEKIAVTVSKLNPPLGGKVQKVSVTLSK